MTKHIARLFNLPGLLVDSLETLEKEVVVKVRSPRRRACCPDCGVRSGRVHQKRHRFIRHTMIDERIVTLHATVRRFWCRACGRTFTEELPGIDRHQQTLHCRQRVLKTLANHSIGSAASEEKLPAATATRTLETFGHQREVDWQQQGKAFSLGVDEHSRQRKQMAITITNLTTNKLLTILPDDAKELLEDFFNGIPKTAQQSIVEVCIDMRVSFKSVIEKCLPHARIVIDPFHVVKHANHIVDEVRSVVAPVGRHVRGLRRLLMTNKEDLKPKQREQLQALWHATTPFPSLKIAWTAKEKVRDLYHSRNRESAEKKFVLLLAYLQDVESQYLKELRNTLVRWQPYILNHFDRGTTNAFTEGCHTKIKMLKRLSFGLPNAEHYMAKMMLGFTEKPRISQIFNHH